MTKSENKEYKSKLQKKTTDNGQNQKNLPTTPKIRKNLPTTPNIEKLLANTKNEIFCLQCRNIIHTHSHIPGNHTQTKAYTCMQNQDQIYNRNG